MYQGVTLGELFEKSSPRPLKNFSGIFHYKVCKNFIGKGLRVILVLRTLCEERLRREPRGRQRKLAFFSARALYAAQNDVKFKRTHARKVFAQPFSKGWRGVGQSPT